jgi:hypothetical protein
MAAKACRREVGIDDGQLAAMAHRGHYMEQFRHEPRVDVLQHRVPPLSVVPSCARHCVLSGA